MTTILHKRGTGIPSANDLSVGEIALDTSTGTAYTKLSNGTVVEIGGSGGDSAGAGMVISKTEPVDKVDGMQWLEADTGLVFIWDEDKWLQFPAGSEGGSSSGGGGGGASYPFTADGDISAGDPVYLKKSGRVANTQIKNSAVSPGKEFVSSSSKCVSICLDEGQNKFVVFYADVDDGNIGKAAVGTLSGGTMTYGSPVTFSGEMSFNFANQLSSVYDEDSGQVLVCWVDRATSSGRVIAGTVSGSSITFGPAFELSRVIRCGGLGYDPVAKVVIYQYITASDGGFVSILTNSGGTLSSVKEEVSVESWKSPNEYGCPVVHMSGAKIGSSSANALSYSHGANSYLRTLAIDPDALDLDFGPEFMVTTDGGSTGYSYGSENIGWSKEFQRLFAMFMNKNDSNSINVCSHSLSGSSFVRVFNSQIHGGPHNPYERFPSLAISKDGMNGAVCFPYTMGSDSCQVRVFTTLNESNLQLSGYYEIDNKDTDYTSIAYTGSGSNFVSAYVAKTSEGGAVGSSVGSSPLFNNLNLLIGFASEDAAYGDTVGVNMAGAVNAHQSGLIPSTEYKLNVSNGMTLEPWSNSHGAHNRVAVAVSEDSILVMARSAPWPTLRSNIADRLSEAQTMDISEGEE
jgi:hypothetical protein